MVFQVLRQKLTANMEKLWDIGGVLTGSGEEKKQGIYLNVKVYGFFSIEVSSGIRIAIYIIEDSNWHCHLQRIGFSSKWPNPWCAKSIANKFFSPAPYQGSRTPSLRSFYSHNKLSIYLSWFFLTPKRISPGMLVLCKC